jgi:4-amino-4-deoxy-L-arabinose transferase-like glycosyltransferase
MVVSYVLFFIAGLGFGYAALGRWKWLPLVLPLLLALYTLLRDGADGTFLVRLVIALLVTAAGVLAGSMLDRGEPQRRAEPGWR